MNTQTGLRGPSSMLIATAYIVFSAVAPVVAFADPQAAQAPHTLESKVSLSDLDLSTQEGLRAAHKRLRGKAEYLCHQLWDVTSASFRWTYAACVKETLAQALQRLNVPALAATDGPRVEP